MCRYPVIVSLSHSASGFLSVLAQLFLVFNKVQKILYLCARCYISTISTISYIIELQLYDTLFASWLCAGYKKSGTATAAAAATAKQSDMTTIKQIARAGRAERGKERERESGQSMRRKMRKYLGRGREQRVERKMKIISCNLQANTHTEAHTFTHT